MRQTGTSSVWVRYGISGDKIDRLLAEAPELELADIAEIWQDTIVAQQGGACPPLENGMLRLFSGRDGTDGFFMAIIQARLR